MLTDLIELVVGLVDKLGYPGLALSMFIESFFAPIPSELVLPFAGFLSRTGEFNLIVVIIVGGVASALGSLPFYLLGYLGNELVLDKFLKGYGKYLFIKEEDVDKGVEVFKKHGDAAVFFGRLIPIVRTVISFPAGLTRMNSFKFMIYTLLGSTLWSAILASLGYVLGSKWEIVKDWIGEYQSIVMYVIIIVGILFIGYKLREKLKSK